MGGGGGGEMIKDNYTIKLIQLENMVQQWEQELCQAGHYTPVARNKM